MEIHQAIAASLHEFGDDLPMLGVLHNPDRTFFSIENRAACLCGLKDCETPKSQNQPESRSRQPLAADQRSAEGERPERAPNTSDIP